MKDGTIVGNPLTEMKPTSPRNHWHRLDVALRTAQSDPKAAWRMLEQLRHSDTVPAEVVARARDVVGRILRGGRVQILDLPSDYYRNLPGKDFVPFLKSYPAEPPKYPPRYPSDMVLPRPVGNGNDFSFITDGTRAFRAGVALPALRVTFVTEIGSTEELAALGRDLEAVAALFAGAPERARLCLSAPARLHGAPLPLAADWQTARIFDLDRETQMRLLAEDSDVICFLPAAAFADPMGIERMLRYQSSSDALCVALREFAELTEELGGLDRLTVFADKTLQKTWLQQAFAFRNLERLAFSVPAGRFRRAGGFAPELGCEPQAVFELCYRLFNLGSYFLPIASPVVFPEIVDDPAATEAATALLQQICPHPWVRKENDDRFATPRVSIYIPAYRAVRYLGQAIDSVLAQDYPDLEVCVADDGSPDRTLEVLRSYAHDPRVRYVTGLNGGIGTASNRAIEACRGMYIGQLDSDDRLKPGAVRRLAEYLDENSSVGCVYGSCERIDANGYFIKNEYSYPQFSREKMMLTSIAHHFRMFRRQSWERTEKFREDIVNAVDYDMFLKLSEVTRMVHVNEILYQRRWHGENTSSVNESFQTRNTYVVQRNALERLGLERHWDVAVPNPQMPREVTYRRCNGKNRVYFWPDYSRANPYQRLLYARASGGADFIGADIDGALAAIGGQSAEDDGKIVFHLHWLNKLFLEARTVGAAARVATDFLARLRQFKMLGGRLVWTIHNTLSHDTPFPNIERNLSREIATLADAILLHCEASRPEIERQFELPAEKLHVVRHGAYVGVYPDFVTRETARKTLGLEPEDEVILFLGQIRRYKGIDTLLSAFRRILSERPRARLVIAGGGDQLAPDFLESAGMSAPERDRIVLINRFIDDMELQLFLRSADVSALPYSNILTSGSLLLTLTYGVPTVIPDFAMTRTLLADGRAGQLYRPEQGADALAGAVMQVLARIEAGEGPQMRQAAIDTAATQTWDDISPVLFGDGDAR